MGVSTGGGGDRERAAWEKRNAGGKKRFNGESVTNVGSDGHILQVQLQARHISKSVTSSRASEF